MCSSGLRGRRRLKPVKLDKRELFFASCEAKMRPWAAQGVNRGGTVTPQKSAAAPHFACGHFALSPHHDRCALRRDRAPAHHKTGPCSTVGVPRAPRTTSPAQNAGNHRTAAAASRSTRDKLRASRALVRETTGPAAGAGS